MYEELISQLRGQMSYKVLAVVKNFDGEIMVLDKMPIIKCTRDGKNVFGVDEDSVFVKSYVEDYGQLGQAFCGRKFTITMEDGNDIQAEGQYWDDDGEYIEKALNAKVVTRMIDCNAKKRGHLLPAVHYVLRDGYERLRATYVGKVYDREEYNEILARGKNDQTKD